MPKTGFQYAIKDSEEGYQKWINDSWISPKRTKSLSKAELFSSKLDAKNCCQFSDDKVVKIKLEEVNE